jgi:hypothetical protein
MTASPAFAIFNCRSGSKLHHDKVESPEDIHIQRFVHCPGFAHPKADGLE